MAKLFLMSLIRNPERLHQRSRRIKERSASKILASVPEGRVFNFYLSIGAPTGKYASGLQDFCEKLAEVEPASVAFHLEREDFQHWLREVVGDDELATKLSGLKGRGLSPGELRSKVFNAVKFRCDELSAASERT